MAVKCRELADGMDEHPLSDASTVMLAKLHFFYGSHSISHSKNESTNSFFFASPPLLAMMHASFYDAYHPHYHSAPIHKLQEDTQEVAGFLLTLKHRSVTPEPHSDDSDRHRPPMPASYPSFSYSNHGFNDHYGSDTSQSGLQEGPAVTNAEFELEPLLQESKLVFMKDRDLVPDALFVAMAQMKPCRLTHADRVGCYKSREIGFVGMCCKHCGGQPGFGRYYPNSVRSLAQTTTSQTILKHIGNKCRYCPPEVREAVVELQRQQTAREGLASGRPRYGSRKIFFQRVWSRLHAGKFTEEDFETKIMEEGVQGSDADEDCSTTSNSQGSEEELVATTKTKRKNRFVALPMQKNKLVKLDSSPQYPSAN